MISRVFEVLDREIELLNPPVKEMRCRTPDNAFQILLKTILSARTTDKTLIKISDRLFSRIKSIPDLERIPLNELELLVKPVNYYKTKARHLKMIPDVLKSEFNNKIPDTIEGLLKLPGVGRKTANLVVASAFGKKGICVDTHVHRIMNRIGYVKTKNPFQTEMELRGKLPEKYWNKANFYLVSWGQEICTPISPKCSVCKISSYCKRVGVSRSR